MAKDINYSKNGLRISSLRKKAGLTQEVLAARCGCTSNHLSNVEVGKCKPSLDLRQYRINATIRIIQQVPSKNCG